MRKAPENSILNEIFKTRMENSSFDTLINSVERTFKNSKEAFFSLENQYYSVYEYECKVKYYEKYGIKCIKTSI